MSLSPPSDRYDRRVVGWLSLGQLVTWGSVFYGFSLLMEPVERELGLGRAQSSLAFSLALLVEGALAYPVGRWIDRGHERLVMAGGSLVVAAGLGLHAFVSGIASFYAVWMLLGAGLSATLYPPVFAVVTRRYPQDFRRAIITLTFLGGLASTVFIPLTAWLVDTLGWRGAAGVLALLHLGLCVPLHAWVLARGVPPPAPPHPAHAPHEAPGRLMRGAPFLLVAVFTVGMMGVAAALPAHMVSLLREAGLPAAWVVGVPASVGVIQVLGRALLYVSDQRFDPHLANRLVPLLIPLGLATLLACLAAGGSFTLALVFIGVYGLGNGMITIVKGTAIAQYVSRAHVATLNGALGLPIALARALAPWLMGLLWTPAGGYTAGLWVMLGASLLAALALWGAQRLARQAA
ncbi:MFS transporter [Ramlibacter sp. MAHUQ-53]|uniref:MFS transporter n=1 Tax=unclassified Ramlibacter TaxID=2617605 RepID=UPI0036394693